MNIADTLGLVVLAFAWSAIKGVADHFFPQGKNGSADHYGAIVFAVVVLTAFEVNRIERKLDAMNTCETAEVVVSGEGEE